MSALDGDAHARRGLPRRRDRRARGAVAPRSRCATSCGCRGPAPTTSAPAAASASASRASVGVQLAAARPAGRLRGRRGLRAVRDPGAVDRRRLRGAGHGPRAAQRRVRDPEVVLDAREGRQARPGLDLPRLDVAGVAEGYGVRARRVERPRRADERAERRDRLRPAPELVEVQVAPGMSPRLGDDPARARPATDRGPAGGARPHPTVSPTRWRPARRSRCAGTSIACSAPTACRARASDLVALRLRREPVPPDPEGGRRWPTTPTTCAKVFELRPRARGSPVTLRAGGHEPQRPGPGRRHPGRRAPHFAAIDVEDDGAAVRVAAGHGARARRTALLAPHGRKLGPDPASTDAATVGGVIANNSGGMRCGIVPRLPTDGALDDVRAAVGHGDRHGGAGRRGAASPQPSPSWPRACSRSATRSAPTPSWPSASGASSRSRTPPATGSSPSSTPTRRSRSSGACSSARRARWRSSPRRCSRPSRSRRARQPRCCSSRTSTPPWPRSVALVDAGASAVELMVAMTLQGRPRRSCGRRRAGTSCRSRPPRCWSSSAPTTMRRWTARSAAAEELLAGVELLPGRHEFTRDPEATELFWKVREGMFGTRRAHCVRRARR